MNDEDRGKIRNREFAQQLRDFSGLRFGKITPTDIDAFLDFQNNVFIFIEAKHGGGMPPTGQRIALERLCDTCEKGKVSSVVLIAWHEGNGDIKMADLPVTFVRMRGHWREPSRHLTVRQAIDDFLFWHKNHRPSHDGASA